MGRKIEGKIQRADLTTGLITVGIALYVFIETSAMPVIAAHTLGSAFWPRIVAAALLLLGAILVVQSLTVYRGLSYFVFEEGKEGNFKDLLILSGMTVIYGVLWNLVPFLLISPLYVLISGRILRLRTFSTVLLAVLLPAALYLLFRIGLRVMIV